MSMYEDGGIPVAGSPEEFKHLLISEIQSNLDLVREDIPTTEFLSMQNDLFNYLKGNDSNLIEAVNLSLADEYEDIDLAKWNSGFTPFDQVLDGFYQGIFMIMARPGSGKTTMMLSIMEELRKNNQADSLWFFELEIPGNLMLYRTKELRKRTQFLKDDRFICGINSMAQVNELLDQNPNPNRVIFFDSPDVLAGGSADNRRFVLEDIYRELLRIKNNCKAVIVASQPKQSDAEITITSAAESWSKAWYSDAMVGINRLRGTDENGYSQVRINNVKNRFGVSGNQLVYRYNYANLTWEMQAMQPGDDEENW